MHSSQYRSKNGSVCGEQKEESYQEKYKDLFKKREYDGVSEEDVRKEGEKLKAALRDLDNEVDALMNRLQPKIEKKINKIRIMQKSRMKTDTEPILDPI